MSVTKLITFERDNIVTILNNKAFYIVIDVLDEVYGDDAYYDEALSWNYYDKKQFHDAFNSFKKKRQNYYLGKMKSLSEFVELFDVYINRRAYRFLSYMGDA